ncbi:mannosyltransferase [Ophidiomyces ophidiicola]|nr:mannosyltransferase [Ophidiomyces ophidiicola]KAI2144477.1 mannosyltransferase [Ophidiomyces ophidiicola]KAI2147287.1 mannosyltransferase [Ophidiomyces ophidiicola]KAI2225906.1 mannosyltransferase [Ophidiomyces ophidiicola]KAI2432782.1 mannosyltransferase [Ophidiomyces ophidiicola]
MPSEDHEPKDGASAASPNKPKPVPQTFFLPLNVVFYLCLFSNVLTATLAPIQDCDETFNYWEPTHYLSHGYGLQTWEYSPTYSIRSWLYIAVHACFVKMSTFLTRTKSAQFYFLRVVLAFVCTVCETRLYSVISRSLNPRIGVLFLMILLFSPGMFHASTALLPSSFTMYTTMLGLSAFLDTKKGLQTARGIMWFGIGAIVGWPFAGALVIPFVLEELVLAVIFQEIRPAFHRILSGGIRCLGVLLFEVVVDSLFYRKLVVVPWNIVAYNVFGGAGKGPEIFGTEPWTFYPQNLLLNFNIWFVLALLSGPLLILQMLFRLQKTSKQTLLRSITYLLPFYLWLGIFILQPHKEERFMYPAYPFLALNAAIGLHIVLAYLGSTDRRELVGRIPVKLKFVIIISGVFLALNVGILRIAGTFTAYSAPLKVFNELEQVNITAPEASVCVGKEWYRFPSSFFLPQNLHAKFIRNEFKGLLPGEFAGSADAGPFAGTWLIPSGMNDMNQEDSSKYTDISQCEFLVDSYFPGDEESELQPHYILDTKTWDRVAFGVDVSPAAPHFTRSGESIQPHRPTTNRTARPSQLRQDNEERQSSLRRRMKAIYYSLWSEAARLASTRHGGGGWSSVPDAGSRLRSHRTLPTLVTGVGLVFKEPANKLYTMIEASLAQIIEQFYVKELAGLVLFAFTSSWALTTLWRILDRGFLRRSGAADLEKPNSHTSKPKPLDRTPGEWIPQDFKRPDPEPYPDWDVRTTKPKPYRPFRYGPKYFITMGLRSMKWDEWIELDNHYPKYHADKARRIKEREDKCIMVAPEAMDGVVELLEELRSYLPLRYPSLFRRTAIGIDNLLTGESFNTTQRPFAENPMTTCARLVQDDLALMFERADGEYYLLAGAILLAGFWRLTDKFGMRLSDIHTSGAAPGFASKLEKGMKSFFRRIQPGDAVLRNNYFIQVDDSLAWSHSIGAEDAAAVSWNTAQKATAVRHHYFRSERQSLRRLPRSGAVVFTIRTYFEPVTEIAREPYVPGRLASAVRSWGDDVSRYKGREKYGDVLLEYLDRKHEEQLAAGLDLDEEDEVRRYPF